MSSSAAPGACCWLPMVAPLAASPAPAAEVAADACDAEPNASPAVAEGEAFEASDGDGDGLPDGAPPAQLPIGDDGFASAGASPEYFEPRFDCGGMALLDVPWKS